MLDLNAEIIIGEITLFFESLPNEWEQIEEHDTSNFKTLFPFKSIAYDELYFTMQEKCKIKDHTLSFAEAIAYLLHMEKIKYINIDGNLGLKYLNY